jgi:hypothetical protein
LHPFWCHFGAIGTQFGLCFASQRKKEQDRSSRPQMEPRWKPRSKPKRLIDRRPSPDRHEIGPRSGSRSKNKPKSTQIRTRSGPDRGRLWSRSPALTPRWVRSESILVLQGRGNKENEVEQKAGETGHEQRADFWHLGAGFAPCPTLSKEDS